MIEVPLSQDKIAFMDNDAYERSVALNISWYALKTRTKGVYYAIGNYPMVNGTRKKVKMHRFVLELADDDTRHVDHIDCNTLNNCRSNLRTCTIKENIRNKRKTNFSTASKYKGVRWRKSRSIWIATIVVDGKLHYLGCSQKEEDAYKLYCEAAKKYHGDFANFG